MDYTTIDDPSEFFNTILWSGNGNDDRNLTGVGFAPDWVWIQARTGSHNNYMYDTTRGANNQLITQATNAESTVANKLQAFQSDGFQVGSSDETNKSTSTYVACNWKANGGTTTTNDASATGVGTIDSVYQANTTAGFSIVTYTGTTSAGTVANGLGAVPKMIIIKNRDDGAENWAVYHAGIASDAETDYMYLDTTNAAADDANLFNDTAPTSTVFSIGTSGVVNQAEAHVAYCFAEKQGYSKFGSYAGNITSGDDGVFVYTGFKPAWIMVKSDSNSGQEWVIFDNKRDTINQMDAWLYANASTAEDSTGDARDVDFLSNGFKFRNAGGPTTYSGRTYVYMAFAEHPFVSSKGVPVTAR